jgi:hypothetical protein
MGLWMIVTLAEGGKKQHCSGMVVKTKLQASKQASKACLHCCTHLRYFWSLSLNYVKLHLATIGFTIGFTLTIVAFRLHKCFGHN